MTKMISEPGVQLAQEIERACVESGISFEAFLCACLDCRYRMQLVLTDVSNFDAKKLGPHDLKQLCTSYWNTFRRGAAQA